MNEGLASGSRAAPAPAPLLNVAARDLSVNAGAGDSSLVAPAQAPSVNNGTLPAGTRIVSAVHRLGSALALPVASLVVAGLIFGLFMIAVGHNPVDVYGLIWRGGFGSAFAWQNTLSRAAPIILTAVAVAIPARMGLIQIGGEGALALGGLAASLTGIGLSGAPAPLVQACMLIAAMAMGGLWIAAIGALRHYRGVNETISSLLLAYIAIALFNHLVEGPFKDPGSLNKPSTRPLDAVDMIGNMPGFDVHWGLAAGVLFCLIAHVALNYTRYGFALDTIGANPRVALLAGLPVGEMIVAGCFIGGAAAGLAGGFEVAAVHGNANASLIAGYGYTGILVAFVARHQPVAIVPVAFLFGGIGASSGLLQRRLNLPDASVLVLQGVAFLVILAADPVADLLRSRLRRRAP